MNIFPSRTGFLKMDAAKHAAFGRADLIAAVAVVSVLTLLKAAGMSAARTTSQSIGCIENLRTLTRAWQQFALDKHYFPPNPDDGNTVRGFNWVPGQAGKGGAQEFNSDILMDSSRSLLVPYLAEKGARIYRCPEDLREGIYQGNDPQKRGARVAAARSYSMNGAVGSDPYAKVVGTPIGGPWLDNNHGHTRLGPWRTYGYFDDIVDPSPSSLAVLIDENASSINDGTFSFGMVRQEWIDWPGSRHDAGAVVSFADGHTELQRWMDPRTVGENKRLSRLSVPGSVDYRWLRERTSAPKLLSRTLLVPRPESIGPAAVKLVWLAQVGVGYRVEFSDDLIIWKPLEASIEIDNQAASVVDASPNVQAGRFYRIIPTVL